MSSKCPLCSFVCGPDNVWTRVLRDGSPVCVSSNGLRELMCDDPTRDNARCINPLTQIPAEDRKRQQYLANSYHSGAF